jgi:hypothetical protein
MSVPVTVTSTALYSPSQIRERAIHRRAVEAAIWGMPAVNYELMFQEMVRKAGGGFNQIVYWPRLLDWRTQTLTPNPDVICLMPFFNTKDAGPIVLEIPPADEGMFNGSVMNLWQAAIEDIGPGGMDTGDGGKYLLLPPDYDRARVPSGYHALPCDTHQGYAVLGSVLECGDAAGLVKAVAYARRIRLYPFMEADSPPPTTFVDASDVIFDATIPYDSRFFESLNRIIQAEPWLERDRAMIDPLKTIGIERGTPFKPDAKMQRLLNEAMVEAKSIRDDSYARVPPFYEGSHWFFPVGEELQQSIFSSFRTPDSYPVDARACLYSLAFASVRHIRGAQYYLLTDHDRADHPLEGSASYMVRVPAHVPVTQHWSMTVYNRDTHAFIRKAEWAGRCSQMPGLRINTDGSVDIFFGPTAPRGKKTNWIPTDAHGRFEVLARFYGPQQPLFDRTWKLPDIEKL